MTQRKVLIIDDEIDLCHLLKGYFLKKNFEVEISHTLGEGLNALKRMSPDIVFIDNNLPDAIGWGMVPTLAVEYPQMHICLITAFHPVLPQMPDGAKYTIMEKPIMLSHLDAEFGTF